MTLKTVKGMNDLIECDDFLLERKNIVISTFNDLSNSFNFRNVEIPMMEYTDTFNRPIGNESDIVTKEMYSFDDRNGDNITLRPEFTAGIARAYISNGWKQFSNLKVSTSGPLFRYEHPQKGRYRQFNQIDSEIIGNSSYTSDVEIINFANKLITSLYYESETLPILNINTVGDVDSRNKWKESLVNYFSKYENDLSNDSKIRLKNNPIRIIDSKDKNDQIIVSDCPKIDDYLSYDSKLFFDNVLNLLEKIGIQYIRNDKIVRGLDYYNHTVFEYVTDQLGSQGTVIGGGRYDGLIKMMGGNDTPAVGFGGGIERLALLLTAPELTKFDYVFIAEDDESIAKAFRMYNMISEYGDFKNEIIVSGSKNKRYDKAKKYNSDYIIAIRNNCVKITGIMDNNDILEYIKTA